MKRFVIRENIESFRHRLETETDPADRAMLRQLLSEEEAKLKALENSTAEADPGDLREPPGADTEGARRG